jgi:hypothetical protein
MIQTALLKISRQEGIPEAVERLIPSLVKELEYPQQVDDQNIQRLRHGLLQYYIRHYRPEDASSHIE